MRRYRPRQACPSADRQISSSRDRVLITSKGGERQSGSKECGSYRLGEILVCIKSNVFIFLTHLNLNDLRLPPCLRRSGYAQAGLNLFHPTASPPFQKVSFFHITTQSPRGKICKGDTTCLCLVGFRMLKNWAWANPSERLHWPIPLLGWADSFP